MACLESFQSLKALTFYNLQPMNLWTIPEKKREVVIDWGILTQEGPVLGPTPAHGSGLNNFPLHTLPLTPEKQGLIYF